MTSIVWEDVKNILNASWKKLLGISVLIGFMIFILNMFVSISLYANQFSDGLREKLGMYFYIEETAGEEHLVYREVMALKDELENKGLDVVFSSKEDAFLFLQDRMPDVIASFERFDIDNPLPATLFVMFDDEQEYQALRSVIVNYRDIIMNVEDIREGTTLQDQENRVLNVINITNFVVGASYVLIVILLLAILALLAFLLRAIFAKYHTKLEVKKLLGASYTQMRGPFLRLTTIVLVCAFVMTLVLIAISTGILEVYVQQLFQTSMIDVIMSNWIRFGSVAIGQILILLGISLIMTYLYVTKLEKKIG